METSKNIISFAEFKNNYVVLLFLQNFPANKWPQTKHVNMDFPQSFKEASITF